MLTETEKAYLAGFLDADGCINVSCHNIPGSATPTHYLQVTIVQANGPFLEKWCNLTSLGRVYEMPPSDLAKKKVYQWTMNGKQAETFLTLLLPYIDIKHPDAELALMFRKTKHGRAGGRITPANIIKIREQYKTLLQQVKSERGEPLEKPSEIEEYEVLINSQLCLFTMTDN